MQLTGSLPGRPAGLETATSVHYEQAKTWPPRGQVNSFPKEFQWQPTLLEWVSKWAPQLLISSSVASLSSLFIDKFSFAKPVPAQISLARSFEKTNFWKRKSIFAQKQPMERRWRMDQEEKAGREGEGENWITDHRWIFGKFFWESFAIEQWPSRWTAKPF